MTAPGAVRDTVAIAVPPNVTACVRRLQIVAGSAIAPPPGHDARLAYNSPPSPQSIPSRMRGKVPGNLSQPADSIGQWSEGIDESGHDSDG